MVCFCCIFFSLQSSANVNVFRLNLFLFNASLQVSKFLNQKVVELFIRRRLDFCFLKKWYLLPVFLSKDRPFSALNQVCAFCHAHKALQVYLTASRHGKKHSYQISHRGLLKPNSKCFQRFHLLRLAQLLPMIRLSIHHPHRMTEQSLAGGTRGQNWGNPCSVVPGCYFEPQRCSAVELGLGKQSLLSWNAS